MIKNHLIKIVFIFLILNVQKHCYLQGEETLSLPFSLMLGMGFEETNTKWSSPIATESYEHIKFLLFQIESSSIVRNVCFSTGGDYGIFGTGEVEIESLSRSTYLSTQGNLADAYFSLGYLIPLTPDHLTATYLTPEGGYSGYWLTLNTSASLLKELWYGPFLGGFLKISTNQGLVVDMSYHYHWLTLHHTIQASSSPGKFKFHNAYGHEAELKIQTYLFQNIKLGAALHYFYYRKAHSTSYNAQREDLAISLQYIYDF